MIGDRSNRHAKEMPTRCAFYTFASLAGGATLTNLGGFAGVLINANGEQTFLSLFVPHDFRKLKHLCLVLIPREANPAMTIRTVCNFAHDGEVYTTHSKTLDHTFIAALDVVQEIDLTALLDTLIVPLHHNDYIGIEVTRVAGQNTNAMVLGIRLRYL